jgi:hypothetical protein
MAAGMSFVGTASSSSSSVNPLKIRHYVLVILICQNETLHCPAGQKPVAILINDLTPA